MDIGSIAQYGAVGICILLILLLGNMNKRWRDSLDSNTKTMSELVTALTVLKTIIEERLPHR